MRLPHAGCLLALLFAAAPSPPAAAAAAAAPAGDICILPVVFTLTCVEDPRVCLGRVLDGGLVECYAWSP